MKTPSLQGLFRHDGTDSDWMHFSTPSWTRPGIRHDMHIARSDGLIVCECEDCQRRRKQTHLMVKGNLGGCKHIKLFRLLVAPFIEHLIEE